MCCVAPLRLGCHAAQEGDSSPETRGRHTAPYTSHPAPAQGDSAQYRSWRGGGGGGGGPGDTGDYWAAETLSPHHPAWPPRSCSEEKAPAPARPCDDIRRGGGHSSVPSSPVTASSSRLWGSFRGKKPASSLQAPASQHSASPHYLKTAS